MGNVAVVSEVHATSRFRVEYFKADEFLCILEFALKTHAQGNGAAGWPLDQEGRAKREPATSRN
jgi:hypothetical protein